MPIALVTGGNRGLGRNALLHLAERGVDAIFTWRSNEAEAQAVKGELEARGRRAAALHLDTADTASFDRFVSAVRDVLGGWGAPQFHYLVNNAGQGVHASFAETTEAQFDALMATHVKGPFFLTQKLLALVANNGRILNVSSGLARFALPGYAAYAAMKGAVEVLTRYQAKELGSRGIRVNVIAPGAIETDFGGGVVRDNPEINAMVAQSTALGRAGQPDDIGAAIAALLSDDLAWVNGQRIEVSGGTLL